MNKNTSTTTAGKTGEISTPNSFDKSSGVLNVDTASTYRKILDFNTDWLYSANDYENGYLSELDDSSFTPVCAPHANKILEKYKGDDFQEQINSYRFISWYRRHFSLDSSYSDKRIRIEFQAVATIADVYVNGEFVGNHKGAYNSFIVDVTDYVKTDGSDNVVAVRVDSTKQQEVPPEGGNVDYCLFGGIVREIYMIITDTLYVDNTFITTPELAKESGTVNAKTLVVNKSNNAIGCTVETFIIDAEGNTVATASSTESILPDATLTFNQNTPTISNPHLWSIDDPYLYRALIKVMIGNAYVDHYETEFGFRWFEFTNTDSESSFFLNGEKIKLRGINRHEQWPWIGRAIPDKLQAADADLIKETGINAVRCSHYPQHPEFIKRCDQIGLIVFEEAPDWQHIGNTEWQNIYKQNLKNMILRDRNHPSIISWGVRVNESWDSHELYEETNALSYELDPTRPTHGVRRLEAYDDCEFQEDIFTINYRYPQIPRFTPFIITEHSMDWFGGDGFPGAQDNKAVNFMKSFADAMNYYYGNDLCAGGFGWSMFDYNNEVNYTKTGHVFYSGLYDIFRLAKPVAYLYRSQKNISEEAVVYIANYWTKDSSTMVEVLSNCDEVELFLNGVSKGRLKPNAYLSLPHPIFQFSDLTYSAGELIAVGYINGVEAARYTQKTPDIAVKLLLEPDYSTLVADGTDITSVTIIAVDENGTRVPYADNEITISVEGIGTFIGEKTVRLEGGRMIFFIQSKYMEAGTAKCSVVANGLAEGKCEIQIQQFDNSHIVPVSKGHGTIIPTIKG